MKSGGDIDDKGKLIYRKKHDGEEIYKYDDKDIKNI